jgi:hypothetical protein
MFADGCAEVVTDEVTPTSDGAEVMSVPMMWRRGDVRD